MSERRRAPIARDQQVSVFGEILSRLCDGTGALGAALVDHEGETVDYASVVDPFDVKIAAAEWRLALELARALRAPLWRNAEQLLVRAQKRSFAVVALEEGYALVLLMLRHSFGISSRALAQAVREVCAEAGLALPAAFENEKERWVRVEVRTRKDDPRRPEAILQEAAWRPLVIFGRFFERQPALHGARISGAAAKRRGGHARQGAARTLVRRRRFVSEPIQLGRLPFFLRARERRGFFATLLRFIHAASGSRLMRRGRRARLAGFFDFGFSMGSVCSRRLATVFGGA